MTEESQKSESYKQADCCPGCDCDYLDTAEQPCWGQVCVTEEWQTNDDDWYWGHACEGHFGLHNGIPYEKEPSRRLSE